MITTAARPDLPALPPEESEAIGDPLHLPVQMVGKMRPAIAALQNPWRDAALHVDAHGPTRRLVLLESEYEAGADALGWNRDELTSSWCPPRPELEELLGR